MKKLILLSLAFTICFLSLSAQHDKKDPLIVINGKITNTDKDALESMSIDQNKILSMTVVKGDLATKLYGKAGENGVIKVVTKDNREKLTFEDQKSEVLVLVNGEEYTSEFITIDQNKIESMTVVKGDSATKLYGKAGENGVIVITTSDSI
jgi:bla regulator protein BlaR1